MASLKNIEHMIARLNEMGDYTTTPDWMQGLPITGVADMHFSGQLRDLASELWDNPEMQRVADMMFEAAERLDDAHEDWLARRVSYNLNRRRHG